MKRTWCVWACAFLSACLPVTGKLIAAENAKPNNEVVKPVRNNVPVYTYFSSSRVWIGVLDKDAQVEILSKTDQWCKVQYTKDGSRFVGWVLKKDLALPDNPPPEKEEEKQKILSIKETSEELRKIVRVGIGYKSSRGESWNPDVTVGVKHEKEGTVEMRLDLSGGGAPAKLAVLARFRRDHAIELYVEKKIIELKEFRERANPSFHRIIDSYTRALEAYNDTRPRIPDFKRLIESAERFWEVLDSHGEEEGTPPMLLAPL